MNTGTVCKCVSGRRAWPMLQSLRVSRATGTTRLHALNLLQAPYPLQTRVPWLGQQPEQLLDLQKPSLGWERRRRRRLAAAGEEGACPQHFPPSPSTDLSSSPTD